MHTLNSDKAKPYRGWGSLRLSQEEFAEQTIIYYGENNSTIEVMIK